MGHSETFRKHAQECRQNARIALDAHARATWNRLAERWSRCAELEQSATAAAAEQASRRRRERGQRWSGSRHAS